MGSWRRCMAAMLGRVTFLRVELAALSGEWEECRIDCRAGRVPWCPVSVWLYDLGLCRHVVASGATAGAVLTEEGFKPVAIVRLRARDILTLASDTLPLYGPKRFQGGWSVDTKYTQSAGSDSIFADKLGEGEVLVDSVYTILHRSCENRRDEQSAQGPWSV